MCLCWRKLADMWKKQTSSEREGLKIWLHFEAKIYGWVFWLICYCVQWFVKAEQMRVCITEQLIYPKTTGWMWVGVLANSNCKCILNCNLA